MSDEKNIASEENSQPVNGPVSGQAKPSLWSGRIQLILLISIFITPVVISFVWNANLDGWTTEETVNNGQLIVPAEPILELTKASGIAEDKLRGHWTLVYGLVGDCLADCRQQLWNMRQARLAQARQMHRVKGLLLESQSASADFDTHIATEHNAIQRASVTADKAVWQRLNPGTVYLIDPLGNLMMQYPADVTAKEVLDDLKRLLRVSRIG